MQRLKSPSFSTKVVSNYNISCSVPNFHCKKITNLFQVIPLQKKKTTPDYGNRLFCLPLVHLHLESICLCPIIMSVHLRFIWKSFKTDCLKVLVAPCRKTEYYDETNHCLRSLCLRWLRRSTKGGGTFHWRIIQKDKVLTKLACSHFSARFNFYIAVTICCIINFIN